jgi:hypothetical protein
MKTTRGKLRELIKEVLLEITRINSSIYDSELEELITFAQEYGSMSLEAKQSLGLLLSGDWEDVAQEDIEEIRSHLVNTNQEVDMMLSSWDDEMGMGEKEFAA